MGATLRPVLLVADRSHEWINWHATASSAPYKWELTENGHDFSVGVRARVLTHDPALEVTAPARLAGAPRVHRPPARRPTGPDPTTR